MVYNMENIFDLLNNSEQKKAIDHLKNPEFDLEQKDLHNNSILIHTVKTKSTHVLDYLLSTHKCYIDYSIDQTNIYNETALHYASSQGNVDMVEKLLLAGANINLENNVGYSAIDFASLNHHIKVAELLVNNGAKLKEIEHRFLEKLTEENSKITNLFDKATLVFRNKSYWVRRRNEETVNVNLGIYI